MKSNDNVHVTTTVAKWEMFLDNGFITSGQAMCARIGSFNVAACDETTISMPREQFDKIRAIFVKVIGPSKFDASVTVK